MEYGKIKTNMEKLTGNPQPIRPVRKKEWHEVQTFNSDWLEVQVSKGKEKIHSPAHHPKQVTQVRWLPRQFLYGVKTKLQKVNAIKQNKERISKSERRIRWVDKNVQLKKVILEIGNLHKEDTMSESERRIPYSKGYIHELQD